jgi:hypothetical protein
MRVSIARSSRPIIASCTIPGYRLRDRIETYRAYHPLCSATIRDMRRMSSVSRDPFTPQCSPRSPVTFVANRSGDFGRSRGETRDQSKAEIRASLPTCPSRLQTAQGSFRNTDSTSQGCDTQQTQKGHASALFVMSGNSEKCHLLRQLRRKFAQRMTYTLLKFPACFLVSGDF